MDPISMHPGDPENKKTDPPGGSKAPPGKKVRQIRMNPKVARGLPCLSGTQVPVTVYLELFKKGYTVDRIVTECYPDLSAEDVLFAIDFVIDWVRRAPGYLPDLMDHSE